MRQAGSAGALVSALNETGRCAETLQIPQGTVMNRLFRARQKLRAEMVRLQESTI